MPVDSAAMTFKTSLWPTIVLHPLALSAKAMTSLLSSSRVSVSMGKRTVGLSLLDFMVDSLIFRLEPFSGSHGTSNAIPNRGEFTPEHSLQSFHLSTNQPAEF